MDSSPTCGSQTRQSYVATFACLPVPFGNTYDVRFYVFNFDPVTASRTPQIEGVKDPHLIGCPQEHMLCSVLSH